MLDDEINNNNINTINNTPTKRNINNNNNNNNNKNNNNNNNNNHEDIEVASENLLNKVFFGKYKCIKKIGEGSFGMIYKCEYNGKYYALKFEDRINGQSLLEGEATIMSYLKGPNIPETISFGYSGNYNILVMQLLGKSLEDLFEQYKQFTIKTVCQLGIQMLTVLEYIHNKHIIHRDIKPDNFVMGNDNLSYILYLLDFGLAKKYRSSTTLQQYPMINKKRLTGTARYASINALRGYEQSRRDDLEAVGYVLMYFLRGSLPWQGLQAKGKDERYKKILQRKIDTNSYDLCYGFPNEFERYVEYTKNMEYTEEPKYEMLKNNFLRVLKREQMNMDFIYDWSTPEEIRYRKSQKFRNEIDNNTTQYNDDNNFNYNNTNNIYNGNNNLTSTSGLNKRKNSYKRKHSTKKKISIKNNDTEGNNNSEDKKVFIYTNTNDVTQNKNKSSDDEDDEEKNNCCNGCIIF